MTNLFWNIELKLTFTTATELLVSTNAVVLENPGFADRKQLGKRSKLVVHPVWRGHGLW